MAQDKLPKTESDSGRPGVPKAGGEKLPNPPGTSDRPGVPETDGTEAKDS